MTHTCMKAGEFPLLGLCGLRMIHPRALPPSVNSVRCSFNNLRTNYKLLIENLASEEPRIVDLPRLEATCVQAPHSQGKRETSFTLIF